MQVRLPASTLNATAEAAVVVVTTLGSITNDHFSGLCDLSEYKHRQTGNMCVCVGAVEEEEVVCRSPRAQFSLIVVMFSLPLFHFTSFTLLLLSLGCDCRRCCRWWRQTLSTRHVCTRLLVRKKESWKFFLSFSRLSWAEREMAVLNGGGGGKKRSTKQLQSCWKLGEIHSVKKKSGDLIEEHTPCSVLAHAHIWAAFFCCLQ